MCVNIYTFIYEYGNYNSNFKYDHKFEIGLKDMGGVGGRSCREEGMR